MVTHAKEMSFTGTFEVGYILQWDLGSVDDFFDHSCKFGVDGEEEGVDDALREAMDKGKRKNVTVTRSESDEQEKFGTDK